MTQINNLFVVYDPTREDQPALERAANIAAELSAQLHVFTCIYSDVDKSEDRPAEIKRLLAEQQATLDRAVASIVDRGVAVSTEVEWDKNWYQAAVRASIKAAADMVLKSSVPHSSGKRILNRTSDFTMIRECLCPVLLVKETEPKEVPKVLAAIDICAKKESYDRLNQNVIRMSKGIFDQRGTELHFINAFQDFKGVPDRQELIRSCGIESDKIHIKLGNPDKVIVEQAKKLDVSLVVMGNSGRSGLSAAFLGNTVEKVLDKLDCDVLSMP
ncbi:MAG: universal stress protein [Halioglobus sp.]